MKLRIKKPLAWLGLAVIGIAVGLAARPDLSKNGLRANYSTGASRIERVALLTANDAFVDSGAPLSVQWTGYLYLPQDESIVFRVADAADSSLQIDGQAVAPNEPPTGAARIFLKSGFHPLTFDVAAPTTSAAYFEAGLEWMTPFGWRLVPPAYLWPERIDALTARRAIQQSQIESASMLLAVAALFCALALWAWSKRQELFSRTTAALVLIVLLALGLRLAYWRDYAIQPKADLLEVGSDHRSYQANALDMLRGAWPPDQAFYVQPGMSFSLGSIYGIFGASIRVAQLLQMIGGALTTVIIFDTAHRTLNAATAWAAAVLWAIFPQSIFYEGQLLTHGLEPQIGASLIWLWLRTLEPDQITQWQRNDWLWLALLGLTLGAASVIRPTFVILAPFIAASLAWRNRSRLRAAIVLPSILAVITLLPLLPVTWHNYKADGRFQLLTSNSDVTLYLGNNRDSTGLGEYSPAYWAAHRLVNQGKTTYLQQTIADIRADPIRWLQLMARKTMLYFADPELPNNVDFYQDGVAISPLLAALPLRFGAMMSLALAGSALALIHRKQIGGALWVLWIYFLTQAGVTIAYHVFSRFRAPVYPVLAVFGGFAVTCIAAPAIRRRWLKAASNAAALAAAGAFVAALPFAAERVMRLPVVTMLPPAAQHIYAPMGDALTLIGYDPLPAAQPGDPLFITLYWQSTKPTAQDVYATVQLLADLSSAQKIAQADQAIGTGSFPDHPTSRWQAGQIVRDTYLISIPDDAPDQISLTTLVAAYDRATGQRFGETALGYLPLTRRPPLIIPPDARAIGARIGTATLAAYRAAITDGELSLTLYWRAGEPMNENAIIFVHLLDANGQLAAGRDNAPRNGLYAFPAWQAGEGVVDEHRIALPADLPAGAYSIEVGAYEAVTQARLPAVRSDGAVAPNGAILLGEIRK